MKQISSLDLFYLTKEIKDTIEDQRIDNFYYENQTLYIKIYVKQRGNIFLKNKLSKYLYLTDKKEDTTEPSNFISYLRKYLKNSFIEQIEQIENERILKITLSKKEEENIINYHLFLELFSNGNIILTDYKLNIKNSLIKKQFKDRTIKVNQKYELPPQKEISIYHLDDKKVKDMIENSDLEIVKFLAIKLGLGGKFSEEVCTLSNINKNIKTTELKENEIKKIVDVLKKLPDKEINPFGIYKEENLVDFIPYKFKSINEEKKEFKNYNELIKTYYSQFEIEKDHKEEELKKELEKLHRRYKTQEEKKEEILIEYEKLNNIGNKIYENYAIIDELLKSINKASKEKGWDYIKERINEDERLSKMIDKLNYKNNEIIININ